MIDTVEKLLKDYVSHNFIEGKIDEDKMNQLIEIVDDYVTKIKELNLLDSCLGNINESK